MNPFIRAFMIAVFTTISARAQQETNPPPADFQSQEVPIEKQPEEDRIQFLLEVGSVYFSEEDPTSAITAFERILEIDPMNRQARYMSSYAYIATKQYAKAEQVLTSLIEEFPEDFALKNNLAWLYATAEDPAFRDAIPTPDFRPFLLSTFHQSSRHAYRLRQSEFPLLRYPGRARRPRPDRGIRKDRRTTGPRRSHHRRQCSPPLL